MNIDAEVTHRAAGVLLGLAAGDALGAGYEFGPALPADAPVVMEGGGSFGWAPGQWTDDTDMAVAIALVAADGLDLRTRNAHDLVVANWHAWVDQAIDVGIQTRSVLSRAGDTSADALFAESSRLHEETGHTAGNGSLMRTAPVALAHLGDVDALVQAAVAVSQLTHFDPEAGEACVLWCLAIRHAVLTGELDIRIGLEHLSADRAEVWSKRITVAEDSLPRAFTRNGWVVEAFQGAWSAITVAREDAIRPVDHFRLGLEEAVRGGGDTDTVAAIAGSLLGAAHGASAVPGRWRRLLHGWPGLRARDLVSLSARIVTGGVGDSTGWPLAEVQSYPSLIAPEVPVPHPVDSGVLLGGVRHLRDLPDGVDAVVSLCRVGAGEAPAPGVLDADHVEVWLIDKDGTLDNPHLDFVLEDTAEVLADLRAEGRTVLLHCVQAYSRTPTMGALHAMRSSGLSSRAAIDLMEDALPGCNPNPAFRAALRRLDRAGDVETGREQP